MSRFGFSPCKINLLLFVSAKYFVFENSPSMDYSQKQNILQEPFFKSKDFTITIFLINEFSHHVPCMQIITKVRPKTKRHIYRDQKTTKK